MRELLSQSRKYEKAAKQAPANAWEPWAEAEKKENKSKRPDQKWKEVRWEGKNKGWNWEDDQDTNRVYIDGNKVWEDLKNKEKDAEKEWPPRKWGQDDMQTDEPPNVWVNYKKGHSQDSYGSGARGSNDSGGRRDYF